MQSPTQITKDRIDRESQEEGIETKVKEVCYRCKGICNPNKNIRYYVMNGNMCKSCLSYINNKLKTPESRKFRSNIKELFHLRKKEKNDIIEYIEIPEEEE